jgi:hypothetical protein
MRYRAWLACVLVAGALDLVSARRALSQDTPQAREAIVAELRGFYRDLHAHRTAPLLDHFWPSKVTARWEPPTTDPTWALLAAPRATMAGSAPSSPCQASFDQPVAPAIAVVGRWARVLVSRCDATVADELWMVEMGGKWRIIRLMTHDS